MNNIINNYNPKKINIINDKKNENFINKSIKNIYIINLNTDKLREKYIQILMKKLNINYSLIIVRKPTIKIYNNVIKLSKPLSKRMTIGEVGCYLSHMWCLKDLIRNNYKNAIIFEDDIIVHNNFLSLFEKYILNKKEISYDFLMLGAADHGFNKGNKELIKDNIYIPKNHVIMGTHAIYYSQHGAKTIFDYRLKYPVYFDKNFKELFTFFKEDRTGVCYPNLFTVENTTSNINHNFGISKYDFNDYYYNECYENFDFNDYHFIYLDLFPKFQLEDRVKIQKLCLKELIKVLLMNYFNNDKELTDFHYEKLDKDFFLLEDYKELLKDSINSYTQLYYIGEIAATLTPLKEYCEKKRITSGMLLREKPSRETIIGKNEQHIFGGVKRRTAATLTHLFSKYLLDFSLENEKMVYKIENEFTFTKKYVAHLHCFNIDDFFKIYGEYLDKINKYFNIIVTYCRGTPPKPQSESREPPPNPQSESREPLPNPQSESRENCDLLKKKNQITIIKVENRGYDIGGKFVVIDYLKMLEKEKKIENMPKYILFLHSKTCQNTRAIYFDSLINNLDNIIENIERKNETDKENVIVGGFFPPTIHKGDDTPIIYNQKYLAKEVLYKCLYAEPTYNKLYVDELIKYFELPEKDITLFPSGNCYFLHIDIAIKLFGDKKLYNILNYKENINPIKCFDYNWTKRYYNIPYEEIDFIYKAYIHFGLKGNSLQVKERNKRFPDGMIEHAYERIIFKLIINMGMEINILSNGNNQEQIAELSEKINVCYKTRILYNDFAWELYLKNNNYLGNFNINNKDKMWNYWTNYLWNDTIIKQ